MKVANTQKTNTPQQLIFADCEYDFFFFGCPHPDIIPDWHNTRESFRNEGPCDVLNLLTQTQHMQESTTKARATLRSIRPIHQPDLGTGIFT